MSVKKRKIGNLNVFTIPNNIYPTDGEYDVIQGHNGIISYIPKRDNPFKDPDFIRNHRYQPIEDIRGGMIGKEIFWKK